MQIEDIPVLTDEQREFFDANGYLVVEDALPSEMVEWLLTACRQIETRLRERQGKGPHDRVEKRNVLIEDVDAFLPLVDWHKTVPLAWQILGSNLHLITSHLVVLPPAAPEADLSAMTNPFHRDGGTLRFELPEPLPRLFLKIAYFLCGATQPDSGTLQLIPASHHLTNCPMELKPNHCPRDAVEMCVRPGTAVFFENRCYHGVGQNLSDSTRMTLYFGYGYRWLRGMDYSCYPPELLNRCTPIQRQLLGHAVSDVGAYQPREEDIPVWTLMKQWKASQAR